MGPAAHKLAAERQLRGVLAPGEEAVGADAMEAVRRVRSRQRRMNDGGKSPRDAGGDRLRLAARQELGLAEVILAPYGRMAEATTHILRASLVDDKGVYRDIEMPSDRSLYELAETIVGAFGFDFDHAFGFYSGLTARSLMKTKRMYELFADIGEDSHGLSVGKTKIGEAFVKKRHKIMFLFDYGDEWLFRVELLGTGKKAPRASYPKLLNSAVRTPVRYAYENEDEDDEGDGDEE